MQLEIHTHETITWDTFLASHPKHSIALDGYVHGEPKFSLETGHANFNHHEGVNRIATRCTAAQVAMAIKQGLLTIMPPDETTLWVNDCDQDVCMSVWLLQNWERISGTRSEPLISRLVFNVDTLDTCAGAYPIEPQSKIMQEMCWIFDPYTSARLAGKIHDASADDMRAIIEAVLHRIDLYSTGQGQKKKPDARYETLHSGNGWVLVKELGNEARTAMRRDGIQGFVSFRGDTPEGNFIYSIGNLTPFGGLPLAKLYNSLNEIEGISQNSPNRWGGSDSCGGSPRKGGSKTNPGHLAQILNDLLVSLKN